MKLVSKKALMISVAVLALAGCSGTNTGEGLSLSPNAGEVADDEIGDLGVDFVDKAKLDETASASSWDSNLGGVYFGELEIVGYNYRPGEAVQRWEPNNGFKCPARELR